MRPKLSKLLYKLLNGILITAIGGAISLLIYDYAHRRFAVKEKTLLYEVQAFKSPLIRGGNIINRNYAEFHVLIENAGADLVDYTPIHISFRDRDAKILEFFPFILTYKYKEKHLPPPLWIPPEPNYPYLFESWVFKRSILWSPQSREKLSEMLEEGKSLKEIIEELWIDSKSVTKAASNLTYFENLPEEAFKLDACIDPMEHGDEGQLAIRAVVQNIDAFYDEPPFMRIVSKSPGIRLALRKGDFLNFLIKTFAPHLRIIFIFLVVSIMLNFLLSLRLVKIARDKRKRVKPRSKQQSPVKGGDQ
jgi:hypothetical protein